MRLGQLARKLGLRPAEITSFLANKNILIEEGSNTRLAEEHVVLVLQQYAPDKLSEVMGEADEAEVSVVETVVAPVEEVKKEVVEDAPVPEVQEVAGVTLTTELREDKPELIKAQKVELPGLKVLGKMEFPEPRKKEVPTEEPEATTDKPVPVAEPRKPRTENKKWPAQRQDRRDTRPKKNPIALQREQEAQEALRRRKAEDERRKEKKAQHYYKKVKPAPPTKAMRLMDEPVEEAVPETTPPPRTLVGKLLRWFKA